MPKPPKEERPKIKVRPTPPIKLKDKHGRQYVTINLKHLYGFIPEVIIVSKVPGEHDTVIVSAVLTEAELIRDAESKKKMGPSPVQHKGFQIKDLPKKKV